MPVFTELNNKEKKLLLEKLSFLTTKRCICGSINWVISDRIFELKEFKKGKEVIVGGKSVVFPIIPVTCQNCGQVIYFNALQLGLIPKDEKK